MIEEEMHIARAILVIRENIAMRNGPCFVSIEMFYK